MNILAYIYQFFMTYGDLLIGFCLGIFAYRTYALRKLNKKLSPIDKLVDNILKKIKNKKKKKK